MSDVLPVVADSIEQSVVALEVRKVRRGGQNAHVDWLDVLHIDEHARAHRGRIKVRLCTLPRVTPVRLRPARGIVRAQTRRMLVALTADTACLLSTVSL